MRSMVERGAPVVGVFGAGASIASICSSLSDLAPPGHLSLRARKVRGVSGNPRAQAVEIPRLRPRNPYPNSPASTSRRAVFRVSAICSAAS